MKHPATPFFKILCPVTLAIAALGLSGCESTTTADDGFGMTFTESSEASSDRVKIDD